jgi:hypothetical protein
MFQPFNLLRIGNPLTLAVPPRPSTPAFPPTDARHSIVSKDKHVLASALDAPKGDYIITKPSSTDSSGKASSMVAIEYSRDPCQPFAIPVETESTGKWFRFMLPLALPVAMSTRVRRSYPESKANMTTRKRQLRSYTYGKTWAAEERYAGVAHFDLDAHQDCHRALSFAEG